jgi:hypothetical protein
MPPSRGIRTIEKLRHEFHQDKMKNNSGLPPWLWAVIGAAVLCVILAVLAAVFWPRSTGAPVSEDEKQQIRDQMIKQLKTMEKKR